MAVTYADDDKPIINAREAAKYFGVNAKTLVRWAIEGKVRGFKTLGGHWRFYRADILKLVQTEGGE